MKVNLTGNLNGKTKKIKKIFLQDPKINVCILFVTEIGDFLSLFFGIEWKVSHPSEGLDQICKHLNQE